MNNTIKFLVDQNNNGMRLDIFLSKNIKELTRSYIKKLINMGNQETYGCAVVGGYVYRGDKHYTLYGSYVFGDHCSNQIWVLNKNKNGKPIIKNIKKELEKNSQSFPITISSFGEDNLGELYVVDYIGAVYKFISN